MLGVEWKFFLPLQISVQLEKSWLGQMSLNNITPTLLSGRGNHV